MARHVLSPLVCGLALVAGATPVLAADVARPVRIRFDAVVAGQPFACGQSYDAIGTTKSTIVVSDFRFYVSRVRLLRDDGGERAVPFIADGLWQQEDVALVDFEDGTRSCSNGTPETHPYVEVQVPDGIYTGVVFDLGLPFERNHRDPTLQPSPLNLTRMFWNWNAGYKYLRVDLRSTGQPKGWAIHLGSTGCTPGGSPTTVPVSCKSPNVVTVTLPRFDPANDVIRMDLAALLAQSDVDARFEDSAGCMSGPRDPECGPLFAQFGLPFGTTAAGEQRVFTKVAASDAGVAVGAARPSGLP